MQSVTELFGHFHPVFVHLPIGILVLACFFQWKFARQAHLQPVVNAMFFWGMVTAVASCISGYLLSQSDDYDEDLVSWHQWIGITVAFISAVMYFIRKKFLFVKSQWLLAFFLLLLITVTGHLGGSLTHGSDYLTQPLKNLASDTLQTVKQKPIPNVQEAHVYNDIVQPIFQSKCYGCHGPKRQKGRLRLDSPDMLMKGGKDGEVILPAKGSESELIKRLMLAREDEHHMPPKEKPQLNDQQISLLHWWIDGGADFNKKVKDYTQPEKVKPMLLALQTGNEEKKQEDDIPVSPVEKGDEDAINKLKRKGVMVMPISANSNYLLANFITADSIGDKDIDLLIPLKKQLVWLKLGNMPIGDSAMSAIAQCTNVTRLQLDHTMLTDQGLALLKSLVNLHSLNLVGTKVTGAGMMGLKGLKKLRSVYLYQANVRKEEWDALKKAFPGTVLDSGGYVIPFLQTDTMKKK